MKTKQDVQLELLQELDDICEKNNLNYMLIGKNGLNAYLNHTLKNGSLYTSVAMPRGDIDRFFQIIEDNFSKNRYVEKFFKKTRLSYISFGNKNTTDIHMLKVNKQHHHGIQIRIFPIYQFRDSKGKKISKKRLDKKITVKKNHKNKLINKFYQLFNCTTTRYHLDKWEHIKYFPQIKIVRTVCDSEIFSDLTKIKVDGSEFSILDQQDKFLNKEFGRNFRNMKIEPSAVSDNVIMRTDKSYEEVFNEINDIIVEVTQLNYEIEESNLKVIDEQSEVSKVWKLAHMTDDQIRYTDYYKDKIDYLYSFDLNDEKQFNDLYIELDPVISSLENFSQYDMTYSMGEKLDKLIEKILIKDNKHELLKKIKELSEKKYFIE